MTSGIEHLDIFQLVLGREFGNFGILEYFNTNAPLIICLLLLFRYEKIRISCEVSANPSSSISYHWVFNTTADNIHIDQSVVRVEGSKSTIEYVPRYQTIRGIHC
jgi:hypothetical protein